MGFYVTKTHKSVTVKDFMALTIYWKKKSKKCGMDVYLETFILVLVLGNIPDGNPFLKWGLPEQ